jgi:TIGR03009 family protein
MHARITVIALALTLALGLTLTAQPNAVPNGPPPPPVVDPKLDQLLARWEKETANSQTMFAEITCKRKNNVFNKTETLSGFAKFMRLSASDYGARLELNHPQNPNQDEKYVCTGPYIYVFRPEEKTIHVFTLPPRQAGQLPDDGALPFLFGMKADTAKRRYQLKIAKETDWYTYVDVVPNFARDKADFTYARLAIIGKPNNYVPVGLPKEIFWVEPNNVEVTWDIKLLQRDMPNTVQRSDFMKPELPKGWEWKAMTNAAAGPNPAAPVANPSRPPTVIRPQGGK